MIELSTSIAKNLREIRARKPLIHNITNFVVMNSTANVLLALGASPVMAHAVDEVEEMVAYAGALVLNIGTLEPPWIEAMILSAKKATTLNTPIVLDPVGAGATRLRTETCGRILAEAKVSVVRGNASEILALGAGLGGGKGVDATHGVDEAEGAARELAQRLKTVIAITGPVDLVTDGERVLRLAGGHPLMAMVTGTGCAATAVIGAYLAVEPDPFLAAACGLSLFKSCGERAAVGASGPGSFAVRLIDALYTLAPEEAAASCRLLS
jgi:hydroxyethylthiazole kinase